MPEIAPALFARWQNFYVIVGSSAAALTGLQFVVIALIAQMRLRNSPSGIDAFGTPTIVYFTTVLLLSAVLCAPWNALAGVALLVTLCGAAGVVYALLVLRRALGQTEYSMVLEDWISHIVLPFAAHAMLLGAGLALPRRPTGALFTVAAATLLLLAVGIHNAWDTVTFLVFRHMREESEAAGEPPGAPGAPGGSAQGPRAAEAAGQRGEAGPAGTSRAAEPPGT